MGFGARKTILFLCTGNACRSQMAEGWAKHFAGGAVDVYSAGVARREVDPLAVQVMGEAGVDIGAHSSKLIDELPEQRFDFVVTLCDHANEECPYFAGGGRRMHRAFDDPPRLAAAAPSEAEALIHYRRVRDEIRTFVEGLVANIVRR
ncbi:MAG: arsenate reductase ArsC [Desulfobulbaceae bacterium]|nr:arsenate reductase ArsC [Desulfobulbaceae bacterium]